VLEKKAKKEAERAAEVQRTKTEREATLKAVLEKKEAERAAEVQRAKTEKEEQAKQSPVGSGESTKKKQWLSASDFRELCSFLILGTNQFSKDSI
jgi:hypothetical protein